MIRWIRHNDDDYLAEYTTEWRKMMKDDGRSKRCDWWMITIYIYIYIWNDIIDTWNNVIIDDWIEYVDVVSFCKRC